MSSLSPNPAAQVNFEPHDVAELLGRPELWGTLVTGMVFVHNKRPWATTLSRVAEATMGATARFKDFAPMKVGWEQTLPNAAARTAHGGRRTVMRFNSLSGL